MKIGDISSHWEDLIIETSKNASSIAYGIFNASGKLIRANKTMCYFLGTSKNELQPKNSIVNPNFDKLNSLESNSELVFEGVLTIGNYKDVNYAFNSKIFKQKNTFLIFAEPDVLHLFEENGKMSRLNQEVNNLQRQAIKEKRILQQTLNKLKETQQMLIHSEKMNALGQMIAGIAHEINNPLAFVTNNLYELEKYTSDFISAYNELELGIEKNASIEFKNIVEEIRKKYDIDYLTEDIGDVIKDSKVGVKRVKQIVEDLRKFSRLDESEIKRIDLVENVMSTLTIIKAEIEKKNIQFNGNFPEQLFIDCFPGQLNQAILNILINAIQAVNNEGIISLILEEADDNVFIMVKDNGIGMDKEHMKKIFDPFFTSKPVGSGTGLGLSITYKIINDLHKGEIEVHSEVNKGTFIKFIIPKEISV